jgi:hypothetical protein
MFFNFGERGVPEHSENKEIQKNQEDTPTVRDLKTYIQETYPNQAEVLFKDAYFWVLAGETEVKLLIPSDIKERAEELHKVREELMKRVRNGEEVFKQALDLTEVRDMLQLLGELPGGKGVPYRIEELEERLDAVESGEENYNIMPTAYGCQRRVRQLVRNKR